MARLNDLGTGKMEAPKLDPLIIIIRPGHNYRVMDAPATRAHINWLKQSILEEGVKKPIKVEFTDGKVYLAAGECRLTAAQELRREGWEGTIPAFAVRGDEAEVFADSILDNGGLAPTILEFGQAAQRLANYGWELDRVAKYVPASIADSPAKALRFVKDALELHQAPLAVKDAVAHGVEGVGVSPALALSATRKGRLMAPEVIKEAAQAAKAAGKKVATRPKGEGVATKAKKAKEAKTVDIMAIGDQMASLALTLLGDSQGDETVKRLARKWQKARA